MTDNYDGRQGRLQSAAMPEPILIGTRGWDRPDWTGGFYPEMLPDDWRLGYYANHLRSVLVPADALARADETTARAWTEGTYDEFRFVLEVPAALPDVSRLVAPIRSQAAGLLLRAPDAVEIGWLASRLQELTSLLPVCMDIPIAARTPELLSVLVRHGAGLCWHADTEIAPAPGGKFMVALSSAREPKVQRRVLDALHAWQGEEGIAGLFFDNPEAAKQARLLAELMVV
jgi:hypothetical protein